MRKIVEGLDEFLQNIFISVCLCLWTQEASLPEICKWQILSLLATPGCHLPLQTFSVTAYNSFHIQANIKEKFSAAFVPVLGFCFLISIKRTVLLPKNYYKLISKVSQPIVWTLIHQQTESFYWVLWMEHICAICKYIPVFTSENRQTHNKFLDTKIQWSESLR